MKFMKSLHKTKTVDAVPFDVTDVASGESIRTAIDGASNNTMIAVGNAGNACHPDAGWDLTDYAVPFRQV